MIKELKIWENEIPLYDENIPFENKMTAYLHEDGEVHPAMIVYPGGGYCIHGEWECDPVAQFYYDNGYNAFIVYYRVRPYAHPAPADDMAEWDSAYDPYARPEPEETPKKIELKRSRPVLGERMKHSNVDDGQ